MKYDEFEYAIPSLDVKEAVGRAVNMLKAVESLDSGSLFYIIQPSNILALAGLRAQSPFNEFDPSFTKDRQLALRDVLKKQGYNLLSENTDSNVNRAFFSIMCRSAFDQIPQSYEVVQSLSFWEDLKDLGDQEKYLKWRERIQQSLKLQMEKGGLPESWLLDEWSAFNIIFGMLLGYPGQAISSLCWIEADYAESQLEEPFESIEMPYQGLYCGAEVSYEYAHELKGSTEIMSHQKLWVSVLRGVYEVFSEDRLSKLPEFMEQYTLSKQYEIEAE
jgi:hypothetical protein